MGIFKGFRLNDLVSIEARGLPITITLVGIGGTQTKREADFEVDISGKIKTIHMKYSDGLNEIFDGVYIGIRDGVRSWGHNVQTHISLRDDYKVSYGRRDTPSQ